MTVALASSSGGKAGSEDLYTDARMEWTETIRREKAAFEAQLPQLLPAHADEFVVFSGGEPQGFYNSHVEAHRSAVMSLGTEQAFFIGRVAPVTPRLVRGIPSPRRPIG